MKSNSIALVSGIAPRKKTFGVIVRQGKKTVVIGNGAPVVVQSMTNTATDDVDSTVRQVFELANAGSELVRLTVNTPEAAAMRIRLRACLRFMRYIRPRIPLRTGGCSYGMRFPLPLPFH